MIVSVGSYDKKKKVTEVKTIKDLFTWFDKWIVGQEKQGKVKHWYTRINFLEDMWEIDYGSYSSFVYITDLPEDARNQLEVIHREKQNA